MLDGVLLGKKFPNFYSDLSKGNVLATYNMGSHRAILVEAPPLAERSLECDVKCMNCVFALVFFSDEHMKNPVLIVSAENVGGAEAIIHNIDTYEMPGQVFLCLTDEFGWNNYGPVECLHDRSVFIDEALALASEKLIKSQKDGAVDTDIYLDDESSVCVLKYSFTEKDLFKELLDASKYHSRITAGANACLDELTSYVNKLAGGESDYQKIAQVMRKEGNYPWTDNEIADHALSVNFRGVCEGRLESFRGRLFLKTLLGWIPVKDVHELGEFEPVEMRFSIAELIATRERVSCSYDDDSFDEWLIENGYITANEYLDVIESAMKEDGNYPWTETERANAALSLLPPSAWVSPQVFNGRLYWYRFDTWQRCWDEV